MVNIKERIKETEASLTEITGAIAELQEKTKDDIDVWLGLSRLRSAVNSVSTDLISLRADLMFEEIVNTLEALKIKRGL